MNESLKPAVYNQVRHIMSMEMTISNIGVQKKLEKLVLHLEVIMTYPRILNQFKLALDKWTSETGIQTTGHFHKISKWISGQPKNY